MLAIVGATAHAVCDIEPEESSNIRVLVAFECTQAAPQSCCLKDFAPMNMWSMLVTLDTSHIEMSPLNNSVLVNMLFMLPTLDTFQFEISPSNNFAPMNI